MVLKDWAVEKPEKTRYCKQTNTHIVSVFEKIVKYIHHGIEKVDRRKFDKTT